MQSQSDAENRDAAWIAYSNSLPGKRIGVGCLLLDSIGRLLIVNPTYKTGWSIPGGGVDEGESPFTACQRELREELGIEIDPGSLVCVDYIAATDTTTDNIQFIFDGGMVDGDLVHDLVLPDDELSEWRFAEIAEALSMLRPKLGRRVRAVFDAPTSGCLYLENGAPITQSER